MAFIILSYYCSIDSRLISVSWIIVFTSVRQWHWIRNCFDDIPMGRLPGTAFRWCQVWIRSAEKVFVSFEWRLRPCESVSNNIVDSYYRTENILRFLFLGESQSVNVAVESKKRESSLQMNNRTVCYFFSFSSFYRKCPSIPSSCRPRTWRATWTLAFPTQPLPSSLSRTSTTTLPCWPLELWVGYK